MQILCCWLFPFGFGVIAYAGIYCLIAGSEAIANHQWSYGDDIYLEGGIAHGVGIVQVGIGAAILVGMLTVIMGRIDGYVLGLGGVLFIGWTAFSEMLGDVLNEGMFPTMKRKYKIKPKRTDWPWPEV